MSKKKKKYKLLLIKIMKKYFILLTRNKKLNKKINLLQIYCNKIFVNKINNNK